MTFIYRNCSFKTSIFILIVLITISNVASGRHFKDTVHFRKTTVARHEIVMTDSALNALGVDSLLNKIESVHNTLTDIINVTGLGFNTREIEENFAEIDSNIDIIDDNLKLYSTVLDVKNLQMFEVLLQDLHQQLTDWRNTLFKYDRELLKMNSEIAAFKKDTFLIEIIGDSVFYHEYATEIEDLNTKGKLAIKLIGDNMARIKQWQVNVSNQYFESIDLDNKINDLLRKISIKALGKEYEYLWLVKPSTAVEKKDSSQLSKKAYRSQQKILGYYFRKNWTDQLWMLLSGLLFFIWIFRNFYKLDKEKNNPAKQRNKFSYIRKVSISAPLIVLFNIAPFFDIHPPTAYVEILEFLLVATLTFLLWRTWKRELFYFWIAIATLYIAFSATGILLVPTLGFRVWLLFLNIVAIVFGILWFIKIKKYTLTFSVMIRFVSVVFILLNLTAAVCNLYGRLSLSKILSVTAIYGMTQIIGLSVFIQVIIEAFELQTIVNQLKGGLIGKLNFMKIEKLITRLLIMVAIIVWSIVFSISLNIYNMLYEVFATFLTKPRTIGTMEFRIGNILLFMIIIYISNLFQQGVGSLYGREESNWDPAIKKNASRMAMTRLILIVIGFMLAVAASGLPLDKIAFILGALGVGIGLGLQSIVNNLVSGVILIFEQPFRIGDFIELGDKRGRVLDIGIRSSKLLMEEGAEIILPNGDLLSGRVINWTLRSDNFRIELHMVVAPENKFEDIQKIITDNIAESEYVIQTIPPEILLTGITDKALSLSVLVWINEVTKSNTIKSQLLNQVYNRLSELGIKLV